MNEAGHSHNHIVKLLDAGFRLDGRKAEEFREISLETGVTKTAEGSARVKIGGTEVMAGVKMEVVTPYPDAPEDGTIIVNVELMPLSSPDFESGPPGIEAIEISRVVDRGIRESKALNFRKLCIEKDKKVWAVLIDLCTINAEGNLLDACALAALAALRDARLPAYDGEKIDYRSKAKDSLPLEKIPISVTVSKIGRHFIIDPDAEEEKAIGARITVASLEDGTLCAMQKGGDEALAPDDVIKMIDIATAKANELRGMVG
ncbi:TPA: exosome complex protein Rrp42 [Candidatus Woesearchaeota archaeon]|nr:exosome complex protein Rrp42 [Candidatus Woesearchaeota archaeon]HII68251.1 exosome complex protein Rrp42 [Candidatus Woesearchaeota archaeon]